MLSIFSIMVAAVVVPSMCGSDSSCALFGPSSSSPPLFGTISIFMMTVHTDTYYSITLTLLSSFFCCPYYYFTTPLHVATLRRHRHRQSSNFANPSLCHYDFCRAIQIFSAAHFQLHAMQNNQPYHRVDFITILL